MKTQGVILLAAMLLVAGVQAEIFGTGGNQFTIDFVDIGYAGNVGETHNFMFGGVRTFGAVGYEYRIGQKEISLDQFAKARAADIRIGDGDESYWNTGGRTVGAGGPASNVSWYEAAKFANWLTTGNAYDGAYQFDGSGVLQAVDRDTAVASYDTVYVLPTVDEWYKAAYLKADGLGYSLYASGLDSVPTHGTTDGWNYYNDGYVIGSPNYVWETGFGAEEQNGTYDMMGNVFEWNESARDGILDDMSETRELRGGSAYDGEGILRSSGLGSGTPSVEDYTIGFRVAAIPEPSSLAMIGLVSGCAVFIRRFFMV